MKMMWRGPSPEDRQSPKFGTLISTIIGPGIENRGVTRRSQCLSSHGVMVRPASSRRRLGSNPFLSGIRRKEIKGNLN